MLSYSQTEPGIELTQPRTHLLAEPCRWGERMERETERERERGVGKRARRTEESD